LVSYIKELMPLVSVGEQVIKDNMWIYAGESCEIRRQFHNEYLLCNSSLYTSYYCGKPIKGKE
jgi:hypothetical protein